MNPPFNRRRRKNRRRIVAAVSRMPRRSIRSASGSRTAARLLRPSGVLTLIWRADGLDAMLAALAADFGAVTLLPVHPQPGAAAIRVLARAVKASRAPLALLPGFVLTDAAGEPSAEAEAVLREGAVLPLARE